MRLPLLGTGTPFPSARRMSTANLVETGGDLGLVDSGRAVSVQLARRVMPTLQDAPSAPQKTLAQVEYLGLIDYS